MQTETIHNTEQTTAHFAFDLASHPIAEQAGTTIALSVDHPELITVTMRADGVNADVITVDSAVGMAVLTAVATLPDGVKLTASFGYNVVSPDADALTITSDVPSKKTAPNPGLPPAPPA